MKENLTDIICIGAQKASTSWLHHVINAHPKVQAFQGNKYTSTNKEAHFWDWNYHRGIDWYKDLMKVEEGKLSIDFTPEYALAGEDRVEECKHHSPSAKVIYVLREPVCRAISALRMFILRDKGEKSDFTLEYGDYFLEAVKKSRITRHSEYFRNYSTWNQQYDDMLVINYEDIRKNGPEVVDNLYKYLNLDFKEMNGVMREEFSKRMQKTVWKSTEFEISRDCKMFLEGMLYRNRNYFESAFGITFEEHKNLLVEKKRRRTRTRKKKA